MDLIRALRPYQWTKNLLVFAALIFTLDLFDPAKAALAGATFVIFCAASSSVYLVNDVFDRERDRNHPEKRHRPIAAGRLSLTTAWATAAVLSVGSLAASLAVTPPLAAVIGGYFVLQLAYNLGIKHVPVLDALSVAAGFLLRAFAGSVAVGAPMSSWLLICTIFLSVFIAFAKRRHEFSTLDAGIVHRESLDGYSLRLLDQLVGISAGAALISYALYTTDVETVEKFGSERLILTLPFAIFGIFRYLALMHDDRGAGDPSRALVTDRPLMLTVLLWGVAVVVLLYVP